MNYNPLLLTDFYKTTHERQYNPDMAYIYSVGTPRLSRLPDIDKITYFGGQAFCYEYLQKAFNECFFNKDEDEVMAEYNDLLSYTIGEGTYNEERIRSLHRLGYLPIAMYAVPEGTETAIGVPQVAFVNTHPDFAWLTNAIETLWSSYIWHIQVSVEVGKRYRKIVEKYRNLTCDDTVRTATLLGDFSMRGQQSPDAAIKSSAGWLLSFENTATVPAIKWLEENYFCDVSKEVVGKGAISTEHSVMCSNYAIDGDEITFIKRLLTEIYPNNSFSMVSDSYDYWNLVDNILPQCKEEIMRHNGCLAIRGDSGDPVEVVTKTVFHLWDMFGGTTNSKGYKVLDPHVKALYGDSITPQRCEAIYKILKENGFAINNVSLGVGSFSFMCLETYDEDGNVKYNPYTRDTFGYAIKAVWGQMKDGTSVPIFKNPKALSWKKSPKGCIVVAKDGMSYTDGWTFEEAHKNNPNNLMQVVFKDGFFWHCQDLKEIRERVNKGEF